MLSITKVSWQDSRRLFTSWQMTNTQAGNSSFLIIVSYNSHPRFKRCGGFFERQP